LLFGLINEQFRTAKQGDSPENRSLMGALPMLERIVNDARASMELPGKPPSPGFSALLNAGYEDTYITFDHERIFLVNCHALTLSVNDDAVTRLCHLVEATKLEAPGLNVGVTGEPVLDHDEMIQSKKDTTIASIVSLVICTLIF